MVLIVVVGMFVATLASTAFATEVFLWFVACQACLAYGAAGIAKAVSKGWRDGTSLTGIMATQTYGKPAVARFLALRPRVAKYTARSLIMWETSCVLIPILPLPLACSLLIVGVAFHIATGICMGFNGFLIVFPATYPAIYYCIHSRGW
jgi:hypothetical protein